MKLYGNPMSTCTRKVLTLFAEKGIKPDMTVIDFNKGEHKSSDYMTAHQPFGQVPALEDDGFNLYESRAILRYLDDKLPGASLTPKDPRGHALMEQWISVETSNFTPSAMKIIYETVFKPMRGQPVDDASLQKGIEGTKAAFAVLDARLAKSRYFAGETFSLADICYMPYFEYLVAGKKGELIDAFPHVARWWKEVSTRPSWLTATGKAS